VVNGKSEMGLIKYGTSYFELVIKIRELFSHLVIFVSKGRRLICITAIHGIGEHDLHVVCQASVREWLSYAMFPAKRYYGLDKPNKMPSETTHLRK